MTIFLGFTVTSATLLLPTYLVMYQSNISLGYNLPRRWLKAAGMLGVRIFATGDNLLLVSSKKGMDPQYNFQGTQDYRYAPIRTISFGVDIKF